MQLDYQVAVTKFDCCLFVRVITRTTEAEASYSLDGFCEEFPLRAVYRSSCCEVNIAFSVFHASGFSSIAGGGKIMPNGSLRFPSIQSPYIFSKGECRNCLSRTSDPRKHTQLNRGPRFDWLYERMVTSRLESLLSENFGSARGRLEPFAVRDQPRTAGGSNLPFDRSTGRERDRHNDRRN